MFKTICLSVVINFVSFTVSASDLQDAYWEGWLEAKKQNRSLKIVPYVHDLSKKDCQAASWFLIKGGKYGFAKREATDREKILMKESFETIAHLLVEKKEFKDNFEKTYDAVLLFQTNWYSYTQWSFLRRLTTDFLFEEAKEEQKKLEQKNEKSIRKVQGIQKECARLDHKINQLGSHFENLKEDICTFYAGVGVLEEILPYIANPVDTNKKPK